MSLMPNRSTSDRSAVLLRRRKNCSIEGKREREREYTKTQLSPELALSFNFPCLMLHYLVTWAPRDDCWRKARTGCVPVFPFPAGRQRQPFPAG